jgi:hypothetical protein
MKLKNSRIGAKKATVNLLRATSPVSPRMLGARWAKDQIRGREVTFRGREVTFRRREVTFRAGEVTFLE